MFKSCCQIWQEKEGREGRIASRDLESYFWLPRPRSNGSTLVCGACRPTSARRPCERFAVEFTRISTRPIPIARQNCSSTLKDSRFDTGVFSWCINYVFHYSCVFCGCTSFGIAYVSSGSEIEKSEGEIQESNFRRASKSFGSEALIFIDLLSRCWRFKQFSHLCSSNGYSIFGFRFRIHIIVFLIYFNSMSARQSEGRISQ